MWGRAMPRSNAERIADRLIGVVRPLLVQLLDESPPDVLADDEDLSPAEQARLDAWIDRERQRQAKRPSVRSKGKRAAT